MLPRLWRQDVSPKKTEASMVFAIASHCIVGVHTCTLATSCASYTLPACQGLRDAHFHLVLATCMLRYSGFIDTGKGFGISQALT